VFGFSYKLSYSHFVQHPIAFFCQVHLAVGYIRLFGGIGGFETILFISAFQGLREMIFFPVELFLSINGFAVGRIAS
jgi:hypothetical protein